VPRTDIRTGHFARWLIAIGAAGLALRLIYALAIVGDAPLIGDGLDFHLLANHLADGHGYVQSFALRDEHRSIATAFRPPLYAFYLAGWTLVFGGSYVVHHVASCLLGAGTVALAGLLGRRAAGERAGLVAASLAAVYPMLVMIDGSLRSEALYTPLVAASMLLALRLLDVPSSGRATALGVTIGLAALTRAEGLLLGVLVILPIAWRAGGSAPNRARLIAVAAVGAALMILPWTARNWTAFDRPVLISTNNGTTLAGANCRQAYHGPFVGAWTIACVGTTETDEVTASEQLRRRGTQYAEHHLSRAVVVAGIRVLRSWDLFRVRQQWYQEAFFEGRPLRWEQAGIVIYYACLLLAAFAAWTLRRRRMLLWVLLSPVALVTVTSALAYGSTRFRAAAEVSIVVLAGVALTDLAARLTGRLRG
jgi:4-amino-4-deoxy-L-arabinose transferase-like glycosyltransferase